MCDVVYLYSCKPVGYEGPRNARTLDGIYCIAAREAGSKRYTL